MERVGAEIEKLGFSLVRSDTHGPLEAAARAEQALAALRVLPTRTGIEVWMADATSGRSLLRQVIVDENPAGPDLELIALQTAELLRTSLLGKQARQAPSAAPAEAQPAAPSEPQREDAQPAAREKSTAVQVWCGGLYSTGGADTALELGASLQRFFGARWGLGVDLGFPILPGEIRQVEGSAKLGTYLVGVLALVRFRPAAGRFFSTLGAGAALLLLDYRGDTQDPLQAKAGLQRAGAAYLRADLGIVAASWLRFGVRGLGGASFPTVSVTFAGNDAGKIGPGLFAGFAFAELSFL
ncbi:MAG TPA: hypothetical protein VFZ61_29470 [Polyangiales bacterium]